MVDNDEEDTLTYHFKNTFIFRPDKSVPLTGNEIITMPHPVISSMFLSINVDKKPMLGLIKKAVDLLFHEPADIFWTGRVMDVRISIFIALKFIFFIYSYSRCCLLFLFKKVLFDGIPIDCSSQDFQAQAACSVFQSGDVKAIRPLNDTHFSFSLFQGVRILIFSVTNTSKKNYKFPYYFQFIDKWHRSWRIQSISWC